MYVIASYCMNCTLQLLCELAYLKKLTWSDPGFLNPRQVEANVGEAISKDKLGPKLPCLINFTHPFYGILETYISMAVFH